VKIKIELEIDTKEDINEIQDVIEVLQIVFGVIVIGVMCRGLWISSVMLTERSKLRKYTGEYYDFDIDSKLKEMGLTREQALKYFDD